MRRAALVLSLVLAGCTTVDPPLPDAVVSDRLFCGLTIPGGGTVMERDLDTFLAEVVTPRFPDGFTVWRAEGRWRGEDEETVILEFIHPFDAEIDAKVKEVADEYRRRFRQEAVLRVTMPARLEFVR